MIITEQINKWIKEYGTERDALNVALARIEYLQSENERLRNEIENLRSIRNYLAEQLDEEQ